MVLLHRVVCMWKELPLGQATSKCFVAEIQGYGVGLAKAMVVGSEHGGTAGGDLQICTVASMREWCMSLPGTAFFCPKESSIPS